MVYQHQQTDGPFLYDPNVGDLEIKDFQPTHNDDTWWLAAETIQGRIGNFDLVYSGSYFTRNVDAQGDYSYYSVVYDTAPGYTQFGDGLGGFIDPSQSAIFSDEYTKQTHELRFNSPADRRFRVTGGLFYQVQRNDIVADYAIAGISDPSTVIPPLSNIVPVVGFGDDVFLTRVRREDTDTAVFGEASFDLTDQLTLTAGVRSFRAENTLFGFSGFQFNAEDPACLATTATDRPCNNIDKQYHESGETHRVSVSYDINDDRMVYATLSTGYRPGGINRRPTVLPFLSDTITNYEIGWKTMWMDRHVRFNGAIFQQNWENLQFGLPGPGGVTSTYNAGSAEVRGVETDVSWLMDDLTLTASATYIDAELTSDFCEIDAFGNPFCVPLATPAVSSGTRLPVQPRLKATATARYDFTLGSWEAFFQGSLLHQTGTRTFLLDEDFAAVGPTKGFTTFDLSTGAQIGENAVEFYIHNIFDERGVLSRNTVCTTGICGAFARNYPVQPRIMGIRVSREF
jgi:outer membrane receptor protein involved in Fe transport